jgi:hypothetical protein
MSSCRSPRSSASGASDGTGPTERSTGASTIGPCPRGCGAFLAANGIALLGLAVVLLVAPTTMAPAWPWSVEAIILRIYAPPLVAFGVGFLLGARRRLDDLAVLLPASAVFAAAALVVSAAHRHLFIPGSLAMTVWFVWLGAGLVGLAGGWAVVLRARRSAA